MSKRTIAVGIDIGTQQTKVVVVERLDAGQLRIIGAGTAPSSGMKSGYVVDADDVGAALRLAKRQAENIARVPIKEAFLAVGGISLDEVRATGAAVISRADQEITDLDLEKALESARMSVEAQFVNRRVLHEIPLAFRIDGVRTLGEPLGMKGVRIEADYLFVTVLESHVSTLQDAVEGIDIEVLDCMASPLAGSYVTLSKDQKMKGCVLANIGADTTSIVVYDENVPVSVKVFPMGGSAITDELALGLRISLEDAERVKMGRLGGDMYPKKKVDDMVHGKLRTMFDMVDKHLKLIGKRGTLPAGVILTGGASAQSSAVDVAKHTLALPARIGELQTPPDAKIKDSTWAIAYGVAMWGLSGAAGSTRKQDLKATTRSMSRFFRQFLP